MPVDWTGISLLLGGFLLLMALRVPIAFALGLASLATTLYLGLPLLMVAQRMVNGLNTFTFLAVPFFILVGNIMGEGGISDRLVRLADVLVGAFVQLYVPFLTSMALILLAEDGGEWWVLAFLVLAVVADTGDFRQLAAYAPQDARLLTGSIGDNLRLASPRASEAELWLALADAGLEDRISAMAGGLDAGIGNGDVVAFGLQRALELRRKARARRQAETGGEAVPQRHDAQRLGACRTCERECEQREQQQRGGETAHHRGAPKAHARGLGNHDGASPPARPRPAGGDGRARRQSPPDSAAPPRPDRRPR